ncbi:hypothetical protein LguiA_012906 [Lonicera macranthoides]
MFVLDEVEETLSRGYKDQEDERMLFDIRKFYNVVVEVLLTNVADFLLMSFVWPVFVRKAHSQTLNTPIRLFEPSSSFPVAQNTFSPLKKPFLGQENCVSADFGANLVSLTTNRLATPHYNPQNSPNPQNFGHVDGLRVSAKNGVFVTQNSATAPQSPLTVYQCIANKCQQKEHCHSSKQSQSMPSVPTTDVSSSPVYVGNSVVLPVLADNKVFDPIAWEGEGECWDIFGESEEDIEGTDIHHEMHHHFILWEAIDDMNFNAATANMDANNGCIQLEQDDRSLILAQDCLLGQLILFHQIASFVLLPIVVSSLEYVPSPLKIKSTKAKNWYHSSPFA